MRDFSHHLPVIHHNRNTGRHRLYDGYTECIVVSGIDKAVDMLQDSRHIPASPQEMDILQSVLTTIADAIVIAPRFRLIPFTDKIEIETGAAPVTKQLNTPTDGTLCADAHKVPDHRQSYSPHLHFRRMAHRNPGCCRAVCGKEIRFCVFTVQFGEIHTVIDDMQLRRLLLQSIPPDKVITLRPTDKADRISHTDGETVEPPSRFSRTKIKAVKGFHHTYIRPCSCQHCIKTINRLLGVNNRHLLPQKQITQTQQIAQQAEVAWKESINRRPCLIEIIAIGAVMTMHTDDSERRRLCASKHIKQQRFRSTTIQTSKQVSDFHRIIFISFCLQTEPACSTHCSKRRYHSGLLYQHFPADDCLLQSTFCNCSAAASCHLSESQ